MLSLEVNQRVGVKLTKIFWRRPLKSIERELKLKKPFVVSLAIVSQSDMRRINLARRGQNEATNVLSFAESEATHFPGQDKKYLGEVILCWGYIKKQARQEKTDFKMMLTWFFMHGVLHLLGYEHDSKRQAEAMEELEARLLRSLVV